MVRGPRYFVCFGFFAAFWIWFSDECEVGLVTYRDAFYLSVETQMTIGYGSSFANDRQEVVHDTCIDREC